MPLIPWSRDRVVLELQDSIFARYKVALTRAYIDRIIEADPTLVSDLQRMHVDTSNRDCTLTLVSRDLGLGKWPTGADGDDAWDRFKEALRPALLARGMAFVGE